MLAELDELKVGILAQLLKDDSFFKTAIPNIPDRFFDSVELQFIYEALRIFHSKYNGARPRLHEVKDALGEVFDAAGIQDETHKKAVLEVLDAVIDYTEYTPEHVKEKLYDVILHHTMTKALGHAKELIAEGEFDEALHVVAKARAAVYEEGYPLDYIGTPKERVTERATRNRLKFPTSSANLDTVLGGGVMKGQAAMLVAPTGGGKTAVLCRIAMRNLVYGANVLFITLELSPWEIADRIDAAITGIPINDLTMKSNDFLNRFNKFVDKYSSVLGRLVIEDFPPRRLNTENLEAYIERLRTEEGFSPDVIVIDYADRMAWVNKNLPHWLAMEHLMDELKGVAVAHNCVLWTASQANRTASGKEEISTTDVASSYAKTFPYDVIISVSQTPQEQKHGLMRLYVAKSRMGGVGKSVFAKTDFARMRIDDMTVEEYRDACGKYGVQIPKLVAASMSITGGDEEDSDDVLGGGNAGAAAWA